jgi:hypothetical protein
MAYTEGVGVVEKNSILPIMPADTANPQNTRTLAEISERQTRLAIARRPQRKEVNVNT